MKGRLIMRKNFRVLAYYKDDAYSEEAYMEIVNAPSEEELRKYYDNYDLDYEIFNEMDCDSLDDIKKAGSIIIDGVRVYTNNTAYEATIKFLSVRCYA